MARQTIKTDRLSWINISGNKDADLPFLKETYGLSDDDLAIIQVNNERTRIDHRPGYTLLALRFPVYQKATREITASEVDIVIGDGWLLTIHDNTIPNVNKLFERCAANGDLHDRIKETDENHLLYRLINVLLTYCFPMLDHMTRDIHSIEKEIFRGNEKQITEDVLIVRRNITNFRETIFHHKDILRKYVQLMPSTDQRHPAIPYFYDLIEMTKEIWSLLDRQKETIEALQETNTNLISFKINDVITVLTMFSATLLPVSIILNLLGRSVQVPFMSGGPLDWFIVLTAIIASIGGMLLYFKRKSWI